jgi:hypothetical protein
LFFLINLSFNFSQLVLIVVTDFNNAHSDKIELLEFGLVSNYCFVWVLEPTGQTDDELVGEATLAHSKEVGKVVFELLEDTRLLDQLRLHLWGQFLIEWELLDDQVEVVEKRLLNVHADIVVE